MAEPLPAPDVRASRVLTVPVAAAIGAVFMTALLVFGLLGFLFQLTGTNTGPAYLLWGFFTLPIGLALAEKVIGNAQPGGLFRMTRTSKGLQTSFFIGWLMVGGLLAVASILAVGAAQYVSLAVQALTETTIDPRWVAILLLVLVSLNQWPTSRAAWGRRATVLVVALLGVIALLVWARTPAADSLRGYAYVPAGPPIVAMGFLASGLWGFHLILENRQYIRGGRWQTGIATLLALLAATALGALAAAGVGEFPKIVAGNLTPLVTIARAAGPIWEIVLEAIAVALMLLALDQTLSSALRTAAEMSEGGFLPAGLAPALPGRTSLRALLVLTLLAVVAAAALPLPALLSLASAAILASMAVFLLPLSFQAKPAGQDPTVVRLPLHPLTPIAGVVICVAAALTLPLRQMPLTAIWLAVGLAYYLLSARRTAIDFRQRQDLVGPGTTATTIEGYRLLAAVANPETAPSLLRTGVHIAGARKGTVLALRIVETSTQATAKERQAQAHAAWDELQRWIQGAELGTEVPVVPIVRLAPSVAEGLQATLWEESVDTLLVGWPIHHTPRMLEQEGLVDRVVRGAACEVMVLRGDVPRTLRRILVPMTSDAHAAAALELGRDLHPESVIALKPVRDPLSSVRRDELSTEITTELARHALVSGVETRVVQAPDAARTIIDVAEGCDLTVLGVSDQGFLADTAVLGLPRTVAEGSSRPVILVKRREVAPQFWLRRAWEQISSALPNLSLEQQRVVGLGLRQDARAGIDFYVLIILSSSLAFLGLLQNSTAVIIGAMLVAPLMSPILAMAHGVVRGDIREIRQAARSTANGAVLAIMLPAFLALLMLGLGQGYTLEPTSEILSRTQPALLDLLVAFVSGLAAAYAVSRAEVAAALPGVAIAAALVPPLAVAGYGLGTAQFAIASGALLLFLTNLASIVLAGTTMFLLLGMRPPLRADRGERTREALRWALLAIIVVSIPLLAATVTRYRNATIEASVNSIVAGWWLPGQADVATVSVESSAGEVTVSLTVYDLDGSVSANGMDSLQQSLSHSLGRTVRLEYLIIPARQGQSVARSPTPTATRTATPRPTATLAWTATATPTAP
jgi:uncharacterized hydrophobic protein (TIGR00271 family)